MKSTFACSHQIVASCHVIPSTVERDGRLLELDELPKHVSESQSPASLHPLQPAVLSSQADLTTLVRAVVPDPSVPKVLDRTGSVPHVEDDPFFEGIQSARVPRSIWAPTELSRCVIVATRYQCWSFSAQKYPWIKIFQ